MTPAARLKLIKALHRKQLRAQGLKPYLGKVERMEIDLMLSNGEDPEDIARRYGITRKQVLRTQVNRAVWSGQSYSEMALNDVQRKAAMGVRD